LIAFLLDFRLVQTCEFMVKNIFCLFYNTNKFWLPSWTFHFYDGCHFLRVAQKPKLFKLQNSLLFSVNFVHWNPNLAENLAFFKTKNILVQKSKTANVENVQILTYNVPIMTWSVGSNQHHHHYLLKKPNNGVWRAI
jgi:hypothetical protein